MTTNRLHFLLPPGCSEAACNPRTDDIDRRFAARWHSWLAEPAFADGVGAMRRGGVAQLTGRFFPQANGEDLDLIADFIYFMFMWDDECDHATPAQSELVVRTELALQTLVEAQPLPQAPLLVHMLGVLSARLRGRMSACWWHRFSRQVQLWLEATVWEAVERRSGGAPELAGYLMQRQQTVAMYPCFSLIELAIGEEVRLPLRACPDLLQLETCSNQILGWTNDVFSYEKEVSHGEQHNLVHLLARAESLPTAAAVERAVALINAEVARFSRLDRSLRHNASLSAYLDGLHHFLRGNIDWSIGSARYPGALLRDAAVQCHVC